MSSREILIGLLKEKGIDNAEYIANYLVANSVAIQRHGWWITPTTINGRAFNVPHCSVCDGIPCGVDENTKYCPNCGSDMSTERR